MRPAVLLLLLLCGCKDTDFDQAWMTFHANHVSCSEPANC